MTLLLRADNGDVNNPNFCEVPIIGPGLANRLVIITGIATSSIGDSSGLDVDQDDIAPRDVEITTDYQLGEHDNLLHAATYVSLAGVGADDEDDPGSSTGFILAINDVSTRVVSRSITIDLKVGLQGDAGIRQIAYQVNAVIQKITANTK